MRKNRAVLEKRGECGSDRARETAGHRPDVKDLTSKLTAAEKRVLALVSSAKTNKEIARTLSISPATVKRHLENVLRKLEVRSRVEAAIYGLIAKGCPHGSDSACPLKAWQKAKDDGETKWAI
jgi:DNA-binding CsgD family transcriptional regulator